MLTIAPSQSEVADTDGSMSAAPCCGRSTNRMRLLLFVMGFGIAFLAGDRLLSHKPLARIYGSRNGPLEKWQLLANAPRTPDVVFLGASYEMCGINPTVLDAIAGETVQRPIFSLNLAASSSSLLTQSLLARRISESVRRPMLLYFGVSPAACDITLFEWQSNGLRAFGDLADLRLASRAPGPVFLEGLRSTAFASYAHWDDLRMMARLSILGAPFDPPRKLGVDDRGWAHWRGETPSPKAPVDEAPAAPDPRDAIGFELGNVNAVALREAIARLREQNLQVRLLELPHHSTARPRSDPRKNEAYQRFVEVLVRDVNAPLLRPPTDLLNDGDYFDECHLHADGARKLSAWLAQDVADMLTTRWAERAPETVAPPTSATFASRRP